MRRRCGRAGYTTWKKHQGTLSTRAIPVVENAPASPLVTNRVPPSHSPVPLVHERCVSAPAYATEISPLVFGSRAMNGGRKQITSAIT